MVLKKLIAVHSAVISLIFHICSAVILTCLLTVFSQHAGAQISPSAGTEQQMEAVTESNDGNETQDDASVQLMQQLLRSPMNINTADAVALQEIGILNPLQIQQFIVYRQLLGNFISIYELQAIPGWDIATIERIRPFICITDNNDFLNAIWKRLHGGTHSVIIRTSQVVEKSTGYIRKDAGNFYTGSPQHFLLRYKYQFKNLLQYGIIADKAAGEPFFTGTQKQGFDFYSLHFFARNMGAVKALALGDFTVNMGQGLVQWQSLAFKKSSDVLNIKRQLPVLRPYHSAGEINFHWGAGVTLQKNNLELTAFLSYRKLDANRISDTIANDEFASSLLTSGLHRTNSEIEDKGAQRQLTYGFTIGFNKGALHTGLNVVQYSFGVPMRKQDQPYNLYAFSGKELGNRSVDFSYTFRNVHLFGELASDHRMRFAGIAGALASVCAAADISLLYRNISPAYQSLYSNAFTESSLPANEKGLYMGISLRPLSCWRLDAYADFYHFPWLRYLVNAPVSGTDYMLQLTYKPNKQLEICGRYRIETKPGNNNAAGSFLAPVTAGTLERFRFQFQYRLTSEITIRNRNELVRVNKTPVNTGEGFLINVDWIYKPMMRKYSGNMRLQYFETDGYDSRMYAYENDVLYSFSIPVFYDKGYRWYVNIKYDFSKKISGWLRLAQTIYMDKATIGTGLDEIMGDRKTELKLQLQYNF